MKAIIFDFDGVIVDTESQKFRDISKTVEEHGFEFGKIDFKEFIGKKRGSFLREKFPEIPEGEINSVINKIRELDNVNLEKYRLIGGIKELLEFLKSENYKIVISTGSKLNFVNSILKLHSLEHYFDIVVSGESFSSSKPSPECYEVTVRKLNLKPNEVIVIEDSIAGVIAAKKAKCLTFGLLTYLNEDELKHADKYFKNHFEILEFIRRKRLEKQRFWLGR